MALRAWITRTCFCAQAARSVFSLEICIRATTRINGAKSRNSLDTTTWGGQHERTGLVDLLAQRHGVVGEVRTKRDVVALLQPAQRFGNQRIKEQDFHVRGSGGDCGAPQSRMPQVSGV